MLTVLTFVGIYIAGYLSLSHMMGKAIPCGASGGCAAIASHPSSKIGNIPVAVFGLMAYLLLMALAVARSRADRPAANTLNRLGFWISGTGTLVSIGLTLFSFVAIQPCAWCLASAITMTLIFLLHAFLLNQPDQVTPTWNMDRTVAGVCFILAIGGLGMGASQLSRAGDYAVDANQAIKSLLPENFVIDPAIHLQGDPKAKVTVVEFADFFCPSCREAFPKLKGAFRQYGGKLRVGFTPFPMYTLQGHELSLPASLVALEAGKKGNYWAAVELFFTTPTEQMASMEQILGMARNLGLDATALGERIAKADDSLIDPLSKIMEYATSKGVDRTPTFIVFAEGVPPRYVARDLTETLNSSPYRELLAP